MSDQLNGGDLTASMAETRDIIARKEPDIGAWKHLDWDFVDRQVAELENLPMDQRGPLHGRTVGIKDIYFTQGLRSTMGSTIYADYVPEYDAETVAILREAGALIPGKVGFRYPWSSRILVSPSPIAAAPQPMAEPYIESIRTLSPAFRIPAISTNSRIDFK